MSLSVCSRPRVAVAPRRGRTTTVVVKALSLSEVSNWVGAAFVRIFSPDDTKVKNYPVNNFTGRVNHARHANTPFKDGFSSNAPLPPSSTLESTEDGPVGYVEDAVKGAVSGLRPETPNEPTWTGATTGWRGELHKSENKRDTREGFHTKKH